MSYGTKVKGHMYSESKTSVQNTEHNKYFPSIMSRIVLFRDLLISKGMLNSTASAAFL